MRTIVKGAAERKAHTSSKGGTRSAGFTKTAAKTTAKKAASRSTTAKRSHSSAPVAKGATASGSGTSRALEDLRRDIRSLSEDADRLLERLG